MGTSLVLLGAVGAVIGLIIMIRPAGWLGITGTSARWIIVVSVVFMVVGATMSPGAGGEETPTAIEDPTSSTGATSSTEGETNQTTTTSSPPRSTSTATAPNDDISGEPLPGDPLAPLDAELAVVVSITDGDTFDVRQTGGADETVRLIGVNSPESGECWSSEATAVLDSLAPPGSSIGLTRDVSDRDRFGRLLRYAWVGEMSVNEELVRRGAAISRRYPPDTSLSDRFDSAQAEAQSAGIGLWSPDACGAAAPAKIEIVDIVFDAPGNDNENLNGEWITLMNNGPDAVDMTGWGIHDESASHRYVFPTGFSLDAGAEVSVFSGCGDDTATALHWCETGSAIWNNDGDTVFVTDPSGNLHTSQSYP